MGIRATPSIVAAGIRRRMGEVADRILETEITSFAACLHSSFFPAARSLRPLLDFTTMSYVAAAVAVRARHGQHVCTLVKLKVKAMSWLEE